MAESRDDVRAQHDALGEMPGVRVVERQDGHTPGPWVVDPKYPLCVRPTADSTDRRRPGRHMLNNVEVANLCNDYGLRERAQDRVAQAEAFLPKSFYRTYEEAKANARLIAAAPELLDACRVVLRAYYNADHVPEALDRAFAAVAKVDGGSE